MMSTTQRWWVFIGFSLFFILIYSLGSVLTPFFIAAFLAYLGDPLVNKLVRLKLSRTLAATIVFLFIMALVLSLLLFLLPLLAREITVFINRIPMMLMWLQQTVLPWLTEHFGITQLFDVQSVRDAISQHWQQAGNIALSAWKIFSHSGLVILDILIKCLLIPLVTFYLLRDWDQVVSGLDNLLPRRYEPLITKLIQECDEVLSAFLRGQLLVMLALAVVYTTGLAIVGLDLALFIGSLSALLGIVPYLGVAVGVLTASIAALVQFHDLIHVGYILVVFIVGHVLENMVLTPWLVGDRIGLHPVAVIFAVLAGGHLFGFTGVLLALPVAAMIMVLVRHLKMRYLTSAVYKA